MAQGINVRFTGQLQEFITSRISSAGLYHTASEYIRDLVRKDYENTKSKLADDLYDELKEGIHAPKDKFEPLDMQGIIQEAKKRNHTA